MKNHRIGPKRWFVVTPESTTHSSPKITVKDPPDPTLFRGNTDVVRSVFKYGPKSATTVKKFIILIAEIDIFLNFSPSEPIMGAIFENVMSPYWHLSHIPQF